MQQGMLAIITWLSVRKGLAFALLGVAIIGVAATTWILMREPPSLALQCAAWSYALEQSAGIDITKNFFRLQVEYFIDKAPGDRQRNMERLPSLSETVLKDNPNLMTACKLPENVSGDLTKAAVESAVTDYMRSH